MLPTHQNYTKELKEAPLIFPKMFEASKLACTMYMRQTETKAQERNIDQAQGNSANLPNHSSKQNTQKPNKKDCTEKTSTHPTCTSCTS